MLLAVWRLNIFFILLRVSGTQINKIILNFILFVIFDNDICRFGPEIAFLGNCCLETLKGQDSQTLVGGRKTDYLVKESILTPNRRRRPIAIIARSNFRLFQEVVKRICESEAKIQPTGKFAGGFDSYNFQDYLDLLYLKLGQRDRMQKFRGFQSYAALKTFVNNTADVELSGKLNVVTKYGSRLIQLIEKINKCCKPNKNTENLVDYVFTTAHKAKGLEWETVILLDDFKNAVNLTSPINGK